jgi:hypothetical protein
MLLDRAPELVQHSDVAGRTPLDVAADAQDLDVRALEMCIGDLLSMPR